MGEGEGDAALGRGVAREHCSRAHLSPTPVIPAKAGIHSAANNPSPETKPEQ